MKKSFVVPKIILAVLLASVLGSIAFADSLWSPNGSTDTPNSLFSDKRSFKVGDTVVVQIVESAQASQNISTSTQKDGSLSGGVGTNLAGSMNNAGGGTWSGVGANETYNGLGKNSRSGSFQGTISVTINKVLPNGNLEIKGSRVVTINDEKENIEVSGIIRPCDINSSNTVLSTAIAEARILYEGKGPLGEKARPGFLTRLLDWLWIF